MLADAVPGGDAAPPRGLEEDALAHALVWLTRHHGQERTIASLLSSQSISGPLGPDQAMRALREAGFNAGLSQRAVNDIPDLLLPVILLLKNGDACLLTGRERQLGGVTMCTVVMPGLVAQEIAATEDELAGEYSGIALVATPKGAATQPSAHASAEMRAAMADPGAHWLWGSL